MIERDRAEAAYLELVYGDDVAAHDTAPAPSEQAHGCYSVEYDVPNDAPPIVYGNDYSETETPTKLHPMSMPAAVVAVAAVFVVLGAAWAVVAALAYWVIA